MAAVPAERPRVLVYADTAELGGAETSLVTLVNALGARIGPILAGTSEPVLRWLAERCPHCPSILLPRVEDKFDLPEIREHFRLMRALRPDILHANLHYPFGGQYALVAAMATPGVRTVAVEHSVLPAATRTQWWLRRRLMARVDAHVAVSDGAARRLEVLTGRPPGTIRTIHNGVEDVPLAPLPRLRPEPTIGYVGRLYPDKGPDILIRALALIEGAILVMVGEGAERATLEDLARDTGVQDRVLFFGWRDDVRRMLPTFDVVVCPSRFESFGIVLAEAMLASRAVVAAAVGGVPEIVRHGHTGLLVEPDDPGALAAAIRRLLEDRPLREAMGRRGRQDALERLSPAAMADAFLGVYAGVLDGGGRRRVPGPVPSMRLRGDDRAAV
jgi:glycosyltransferase involved in cell wall biosynthesis